MARTRTIKPEFFTSEQVAGLTHSARLLFVGLWCFSDDNGVHPASCHRAMLEVFPGDQNADVAAVTGWVAELLSAGLLSSYVVEGQEFWSITGWQKHQKIQYPSYRFPLPPDGGSSMSPPRTLLEPSNRRGEKRRETERNGEKRNLSFDVKATADEMEIDWEKTRQLANRLNAKIKKAWPGWKPTAKFREKFLRAAGLVTADVLPESWLADAVDSMLAARRRSPAGYLGKVLASTDPRWDTLQTAVTLPKKGD